MTQIYFILLLILVLVFAFIIFNKNYTKKHNNVSFLEESKTQKTLKKIVITDDILRVSEDIFRIGSFL